MKEITINNATDKDNAIVHTWWMPKMNPEYITFDDVAFRGDCYEPCAYKITLITDGGCFPGTVGEMEQSEYNNLVEELLDLGIIKKCKGKQGGPFEDTYGFIPGQNY